MAHIKGWQSDQILYENVKSLQTDRWRDDGRQAIRKAHELLAWVSRKPK